MKLTDLELKFILEKKPELIKKPEPTLNDAIVSFLKKYEVYVTPPKKKNPIKDGAIAGAVAGGLGADVAGDALIMQGQKKQTAIQEWTQWKQWALDHKEFPKFQTDFFNEVNEYNKNIDKNFEDPEYQKNVLNPLLQRYENRLGLFKRLILIVLGLAIIGNIYIYFEDKNDKSSLIRKY